MIRVYIDASLSKAVIGIGVLIKPDKGANLEIRLPMRSGPNSTEAELYALLIGIDSVKASIKKGSKKPKVTFFIDCEPAVKALYGMTKLRSQAARNLVRKVVKALDKANENFFTHSIEPIKGKSNPAHDLAKQARLDWRDIWKPGNEGPSGPSLFKP